MKQKNNEKKLVVTHSDKILYPQIRVSKADIINYYQKIASILLPYAKDHPIVMKRFLQGVDQEGFFQKQLDEYVPDWIPRYTVALKKGGKQTLLMLEKRDDLSYIANQCVIELHMWLSNIQHITKPDRMIFDLDPGKNSLADIHMVAKALYEIIRSYQLHVYIMTTGSRGYHIVVPLVPKYDFDKVHIFAKKIAQQVVNQYPKLCTIELSLSKRGHKIFIDYLRNSYGQTSIACYSLRATNVASIATPIRWNELSKSYPQKYTIKNIFKRLSKIQDPWQNFDQKRKKLPWIK